MLKFIEFILWLLLSSIIYSSEGLKRQCAMISINISVIKTIYIYTILTDKIKHFFKEKLYNEIKKIHRPRFGYFDFGV